MNKKIYGLYMASPNIFCETKYFLRTRLASSVTFSTSAFLSHLLSPNILYESRLGFFSGCQKNEGKKTTCHLDNIPNLKANLFDAIVNIFASISTEMNKVNIYDIKTSYRQFFKEFSLSWKGAYRV